MQTTCGTPDYISPEMLNGELYTDKVDMWALGVILYAILSGDMPFRHDNRAEMYRKINSSDYSHASMVCLLNHQCILDTGFTLCRQIKHKNMCNCAQPKNSKMCNYVCTGMDVSLK